jgi:hypothetical protein
MLFLSFTFSLFKRSSILSFVVYCILQESTKRSQGYNLFTHSIITKPPATNYGKKNIEYLYIFLVLYFSLNFFICNSPSVLSCVFYFILLKSPKCSQHCNLSTRSIISNPSVTSCCIKILNKYLFF